MTRADYDDAGPAWDGWPLTVGGFAGAIVAIVVFAGMMAWTAPKWWEVWSFGGVAAIALALANLEHDYRFRQATAAVLASKGK